MVGVNGRVPEMRSSKKECWLAGFPKPRLFARLPIAGMVPFPLRVGLLLLCDFTWGDTNKCLFSPDGGKAMILPVLMI